MTTRRKTPYNTGFASGGVTRSAIVVQTWSFVPLRRSDFIQVQCRLTVLYHFGDPIRNPPEHKSVDIYTKQQNV